MYSPLNPKTQKTNISNTQIFIGGWGNTKSVIRKNRTKPEVAENDTPQILNGEEFRGFWIRCIAGNISVGIENDPSPFLSFTDPEPAHCGYFGVCTGWGASGTWIIARKSKINGF